MKNVNAQQQHRSQRTYNCRDKESCPRHGNCLQKKNVVYEATVKQPI